jgi:hypothetical protein
MHLDFSLDQKASWGLAPTLTVIMDFFSPNKLPLALRNLLGIVLEISPAQNSRMHPLKVYPGDQITNSLAIASWALKMKPVTTSMMGMVD